MLGLEGSLCVQERNLVESKSVNVLNRTDGNAVVALN
jgi:hypothetical protein